MSVIGHFVAPEDQEVYSIDESFLDLSRYPYVDGHALGRSIKAKVYQWCGMPVCVGIGPTKTLAKLANHLAKKRREFEGVCDLTKLAPADFQAITQSLDVGDIWGIGGKLTVHLKSMGIDTVAKLRGADPKRMRERFGVMVERTTRELQGVACNQLEVVEPRKQIIASRSFGGPIYAKEDLTAAVQTFVARAGYKLRGQGSRAGRVCVWLETNRFRAQDPQYHPCAGMRLPSPSDDLATLTEGATHVLGRIFRSGFRYSKAGVMLEDLVDQQHVQAGLFGAEEASPKRKALMATVDRIHARFGRCGVGVGHAGVKKERGRMIKRERLSPSYMTKWEDLLLVEA